MLLSKGMKGSERKECVYNMENNKLMLKDYVGKKEINVMVEISIKGQKYNGN